MRVFQGSRELTDSLEDYLFTYDPKEGLIVSNGHRRKHQFLKYITCKAEFEGFSQELDVTVNFHREVYLHRPILKQPEPQFPIVGNTLVLECHANFDTRVPLGLELVWDYPTSDPRIKQFNQTHFPDQRIRGRMVTLRKLQIQNLEKSDENKTFSCYMLRRNKKSPPSNITVGFIRQHHKEAFFGNVIFHGSDELRLPSSWIGKFS